MKLRLEKGIIIQLHFCVVRFTFSLRIDKEYKSVKINYDNFSYKGSVDWEIDPKSAWNYGLAYQ